MSNLTIPEIQEKNRYFEKIIMQSNSEKPNPVQQQIDRIKNYAAADRTLTLMLTHLQNIINNK